MVKFSATIFARPNRVGISLGSLNPTQLTAFKALMVSVLVQNQKNEGYDEMEGIRAADNYIGKATGKSDVFGSGNYYIAFLGKPSTTSLWELQFGGHHYAFANTYNEGKIEGVTPSFRGVNPLTPFSENGNTYQPLEQVQTTFTGIIGSLSDAEKNAARLSATFSDVLLGPGKDGVFPQTKEGLKNSGNLNSTTQQQLYLAIGLYAGDLDSTASETVMARYKAELADTYFAYSGSGTMNQLNDYVRLDGLSIWLELSLQPSRDFPGTNHIHTVWRDRKPIMVATKINNSSFINS